MIAKFSNPDEPCPDCGLPVMLRIKRLSKWDGSGAPGSAENRRGGKMEITGPVEIYTVEPIEQYKISQLAAIIYAGRISGGLDSTSQDNPAAIEESVDNAFSLFYRVGERLTQKAEAEAEAEAKELNEEVGF